MNRFILMEFMGRPVAKLDRSKTISVKSSGCLLAVFNGSIQVFSVQLPSKNVLEKCISDLNILLEKCRD